MANGNEINFKTPSGLKIRLNHRYFFYQLTKAEKYYSEDEIVNNDAMYSAAANIESMFLVPTMLIQIFAIIALLFRIDTSNFFIVSAALYIFGCLWRCSKQDFLLSTILLFFATMYNALWWAFYIALIVLTIAFDNTYLIVPYLMIRIICTIFSYIQNHIILSVTQKKYGTPLGDTEICAFRVFHLLSRSELKISDYISLYVSTIHEIKNEV